MEAEQNRLGLEGTNLLKEHEGRQVDIGPEKKAVAQPERAGLVLRDGLVSFWKANSKLWWTETDYKGHVRIGTVLQSSWISSGCYNEIPQAGLLHSSRGWCGGVNEKSPPWAQIFEHLLPSWYHSLGRQCGLAGESTSLEQALRVPCLAPLPDLLSLFSGCQLPAQAPCCHTSPAFMHSPSGTVSQTPSPTRCFWLRRFIAVMNSAMKFKVRYQQIWFLLRASFLNWWHSLLAIFLQGRGKEESKRSHQEAGREEGKDRGRAGGKETRRKGRRDNRTEEVARDGGHTQAMSFLFPQEHSLPHGSPASWSHPCLNTPEAPLPSHWGLGLQHINLGKTHSVDNTLKRKARCGSSLARHRTPNRSGEPPQPP